MPGMGRGPDHGRLSVLRGGRNMRHRAMLICVAFLLLTVGNLASQVRVQGQIRNRNGGPESQCQVDFHYRGDQQPSYRVYSDTNGYFYLDNPSSGPYVVRVYQGNRSYIFDKVHIDGAKLVPDVLVVNW